MRPRVATFHLIAALALLALPQITSGADRPTFWIDACEGEPANYATMIDDLAKARVVYLGERHTLMRHHETQAKIIAELAAKGVRLLVALEPLESSQQPTIDRFNGGELDFEGLAKAVHWSDRWPNYKQYRFVLDAARSAKAPIVGLSPSPELIHKIARGGGAAKLDPAARKQLPAELNLNDAAYEKLLAAQMMVHMAASPERLRPMIEAQIARDECMSAALVEFLRSDAGKDRRAVVVCGAGHVAYGLGTPSRVRRRLVDASDRIIVLADCGDVQLTPEEKAVARAIEIPHEQLRQIGRPIADYLEVRFPAEK